ncbi:unnamed protein product [Paramecium primaurelia]|uniref:Uncharacterized protein n=1 Tax=Paramecium primaurelia TaxID=5886 RepID=A0A8S1LKN1_PARPR|nr:unnamed protein product [Paramecium primaurelia]
MMLEKTIVMTDEPKIKELNEILQQKNQKLLELEMNQNSFNSNTVLVIKELVRIKKQENQKLKLKLFNQKLKDIKILKKTKKPEQKQ